MANCSDSKGVVEVTKNRVSAERLRRAFMRMTCRKVIVELYEFLVSNNAHFQPSSVNTLEVRVAEREHQIDCKGRHGDCQFILSVEIARALPKRKANHCTLELLKIIIKPSSVALVFP